ncbi:signal peptide peptidase SppA [Candidatus Dependentiae bacterium]|nr:signal peptide peptidase SppA [Candidatus Dependentiae bacterium]
MENKKTKSSSKFLVIFLVIFIGIIAIFSCVMVFMISAMSSSVASYSSSDSFSISPANADIGVIEIKGPIMKIDKIIKNLEKFDASEKMKAVVVIIDSPGGAVVPSQRVYEKLKRLGKKKDIYISMENLCASGGYYIAVAGDELWASPGTLTGSIGVIAQFIQTKELFSKIGLKTTTIKSGKFKDIGSPSRDMREDEKVLLQEMIDDTFSVFFDTVKEERLSKILEKLKVTNPGATEQDAIDFLKDKTDGRIFTGNQAIKMGFIDKIGGYDDLIDYLKEKYKLEKPKIAKIKKKSELLMLLEDITQIVNYRVYGIKSEILLKYAIM